MIPVQGYAGQTVAVLGLGRSGKAAARALQEGGADVVVWDDGQAGRDTAEHEGFELRDLTKSGAFDGIATLIVSPGIPHLYPAPNPVIAAAWAAGPGAPLFQLSLYCQTVKKPYLNRFR